MATDFGTVTVGMDDGRSAPGPNAVGAGSFFPFQPVVGGGGGRAGVLYVRYDPWKHKLQVLVPEDLEDYGGGTGDDAPDGYEWRDVFEAEPVCGDQQT